MEIDLLQKLIITLFVNIINKAMGNIELSFKVGEIQDDILNFIKNHNITIGQLKSFIIREFQIKNLLLSLNQQSILNSFRNMILNKLNNIKDN